ncbi:MAG: FkbM family methyltransferase [Pseudomonadota bacterium]
MSLKHVFNGKFRGLFERGISTKKRALGLNGSSTELTIPTENHLERPTRSFEDFFEHLKRLGFAPSVCIDVGAATGTHSIYQAFPKAMHIAFEPLPDFQQALKETLGPYQHSIRNCALAADEGQATLLRHSDLYGSSIMHSRADSDEKVLEIRKSTLDIELSESDLNGPALLKTDCQGSDLLVLKGGKSTLAYCDVVIVESSLFRFWGAHQPDFYDIVSFMHDQGFALYDLLDGLYRPRDSALGQIDLAFVKEQSDFRKDHYW